MLTDLSNTGLSHANEVSLWAAYARFAPELSDASLAGTLSDFTALSA